MEEKQYVSFCFLILHYMNIELTCRTVESLLSLEKFNDSQIIIVDNASPNGSGEKLKKKYAGMRQINLIFSSHNLGFSAGNNLGFQYIKDNFLPEFVIVINNDILFPQKDFLSKVYELYLESPFWVAGPDIFQPHKNYHSSPLTDKPRGENVIMEEIKRCNILKRNFSKRFSLDCFKLYIRDCFPDNSLVKLLIKFKRFLCGQRKVYNKRGEGVVVQGACLIFDKRFCEANECLFWPLTFLYVEEDILSWRCRQNNWTIKYFPEIQVWHINHGSSQLSGLSYHKYCNKKIKELGILGESYRVYLKQIASNDK